MVHKNLLKHFLLFSFSVTTLLGCNRATSKLGGANHSHALESGMHINVPVSSPNPTNASHNTESSFSSAKELDGLRSQRRALDKKLLKKYYLSEKEIFQKIEEIRRSKGSFQEKYDINLFKGENDPACQKLESAYAQTYINIHMKSINLDQDYINKIKQEEEVFIKLYTACNRAQISLDLCDSVNILVNKNNKLPYAIRPIGLNRVYIVAILEYIDYIENQFKEKAPAKQVMTFSRWRAVHKRASILS